MILQGANPRSRHLRELGRRELIVLLAGAAAAWPLDARAQRTAMPVVGFLRDSRAQGSEHMVSALRKGLRELGFVQGQNVAIELAFSEGQSDLLPTLAADLLRRPVSVIVTSALSATLAAKVATSTVPIVFAVANDPVEFKLVASISRPGGNATGVAYLTSELGGKRFGLLHEMLPTLSVVAVLANPNNPNIEVFVNDVLTGARKNGVAVNVLNATSDREIEGAFALLGERQVGAILIANDPLFTTHRPEIVALCARLGIPAMYVTREFAQAGGLVSYGPSLPEVYRQAGIYAGRILRGDRPSELPVLLPTTFEMVVNLKTAKALGLDISPTFVARADEVIE